MFDRERLAEIAHVHEPATESSIRAVALAIGLRFPDEYVELLLRTDGLEPTINTDRYAIALFPVGELVELAESYEVHTYLPGHLFIGLDGGGRGFFLRSGSKRSPVFLCETGALDESELREVAPTLLAWIARDFDLGDPPESKRPDRVDLYLLQVPTDGVRGLLKICKHLQLTVPVSQLRGILAEVPYRLCHDVPYLPYIRYATEINRREACVGVFHVGRPDLPVIDSTWDWR
jgi:hypothetical protein